MRVVWSATLALALAQAFVAMVGEAVALHLAALWRGVTCRVLARRKEDLATPG